MLSQRPLVTVMMRDMHRNRCPPRRKQQLLPVEKLESNLKQSEPQMASQAASFARQSDARIEAVTVV